MDYQRVGQVVEAGQPRFFLVWHADVIFVNSDFERRTRLDASDEPFPPVRKPSLWRAWAPVVHSVLGFLSIGSGGQIALHHHRWPGAAMMIVGGLLVWYSISGRSSHLRG